MSGFVLDCSAALPWCFGDEATPESYVLLERVWKEQVFVPRLWFLELGNVLLAAERRGRMSLRDVTVKMDEMLLLPLSVDAENEVALLPSIVNLARGAKLTVYDATYLELAVRKGAALATKDAALAEAARRVGVEVVRG